MKTTRRTFLGGVAAASLPATAGACGAATAIQAEAAAPAAVAENPKLLDAFERLTSAQAELAEAKSALEWIADEWRHRWPLAPESILGLANADSAYGSREDAERDIIGRYLRRDTSGLKDRLSARMRSNSPTLCFSVPTVEAIEEKIRGVQEWKNRGRTEATREKQRLAAARLIEKFNKDIELSREYYAETDRLRKAAGVAEAKARIERAKHAYFLASSDVSHLPAFGPEGRKIKLAALVGSGFLDDFSKTPGIIGEMARFIQAEYEMKRRALS